MIYTVPHYYNRFKCIASECPDTCCAGWGIMIDRASLKKYRDMEGPFGSRLHNSIHWKEGSFKQYHGRCAFLNEENLCDLYSEAGPEYLCRTCRAYPRHIEEFEGCREMTLCLSCIEAARIILGCEEPVRFITREDDREETYEDFDFFLYTKLMDARELALDILRNRTWSWADRTSMCLGLAHDLQARIRKGRLYEADRLIERYRGAAERSRMFPDVGRALCSRYEVMEEAFSLFSEMEVLGKDWPAFASEMRATLYGQGRNVYEKRRRAFLESEIGKRLPVLKEQLMVYFVFTYFCGAVYNENPCGKMKMAAAATLLIEELAQALWTDQGGRLSFMDFVDAAHRFSREVEHSDSNKAVLEKAMVKRPGFALRRLLAAVNSDVRGQDGEQPENNGQYGEMAL